MPARRLLFIKGKRKGKRIAIAARMRKGRKQQWLMLCVCGKKTWVDVSCTSRMCQKCFSHSRIQPVPKHVLATKKLKGVRLWLVACKCGVKRWLAPCRSGRLCNACSGKQRNTPIPKTKMIGHRHILAAKIRHHGHRSVQIWLLRCSCGRENWCVAAQAVLRPWCFWCAAVIKANKVNYPAMREEDLQKILMNKIRIQQGEKYGKATKVR
jgi:hypothetical protein